jgi:NAD(P)-dependent dehydrogenase (short-subunit alcohol dehydrogenase family)
MSAAIRDRTGGMKQRRAVLVTGASSGLGRAIAKRLARSGELEVIATVRKEADGESLQKEAPELDVLQLDVTNAEQIAEAATELGGHLRDRGLFALVNNAGVAVVGPVEHVALDDWRRQFEVNLFGQIAMTQAMLPLLRNFASRHTARGARIVMMSSIAGRVGQPMLTPYTASKAALESVSDGLRIELDPQNIRVSLVEPGAIQSEIWRKSQTDVEAISDAHPLRVHYGPLFDAVAHFATEAARDAIPATEVARVVEQCLTATRPPIRVLVGRDAKFGALAKRFLPDRLFDRQLKKMLRVGKR